MFDICLFFHSYRRDRSTFTACPHSMRVNFSASTNSSMIDKESRLYNNSKYCTVSVVYSNQYVEFIVIDVLSYSTQCPYMLRLQLCDTASFKPRLSVMEFVSCQNKQHMHAGILPQLNVIKCDSLRCSFTLGLFYQRQDQEVKPGTCPEWQATWF